MNEQGQVKKGWMHGYFTVPNGIYEMEISGYAKAVYVYLCRRADSEGQSFPGYGTIAEEVGFSRSTIRRAVDELINAGLLLKEVRGRKENGEFHANLYTVIHPLDVPPKGVCSQRTHPPKGMLSENTPMSQENLPMPSENTPMSQENTEGIHTKDYPLTTLIKDTHTQEAFAGIHETAVTNEAPETQTNDDKPNERVCEEIQSLLEQKGIRVQTKTIWTWLQRSDVGDIMYAAELATKDGVRSPAGFMGSVLRNGLVRIEKKEKHDPRYEAFYRVMPQGSR